MQEWLRIADERTREMIRRGDEMVRRGDDMIGRTDVLETRAAVGHWKADGLDLTPILTPALRHAVMCSSTISRPNTYCAPTPQ